MRVSLRFLLEKAIFTSSLSLLNEVTVSDLSFSNPELALSYRLATGSDDLE